MADVTQGAASELTREELERFYENTMAITARLADAGDEDSLAYIRRMMTSVDSASMPNLPAMVEACLDERDALRWRVAEVLRYTDGRTYIASVLNGKVQPR